MKRLILFVLLLAVTWSGAAFAQSFFGWSTVNANLRAGPDIGYPRVATIPAGARLQIFGCLDGWSWCDVQWGPNRGWISAGLVESDFGGSRVIVYDNGPRLGFPFVTFGFDLYWNSHYRNRYWYRDRSRWHDYRPPPRRGPPPGYRPPNQRPPAHRPPNHRPPASPAAEHGSPAWSETAPVDAAAVEQPASFERSAPFQRASAVK